MLNGSQTLHEQVLPSRGKPARICYITSTVASEQAGTEGHLIRLIRALDRNRFTPELVSLQDTPFVTQWNDPRVPLRSAGVRSLYRPRDWLRVRALSRWLRRTACRVVELHSPEAQLVGGLAAAWAGVPVRIGCRRSLGYNYGRKARWQLAWSNGLMHRFLANSRAVIAQRAARERLDPERFELIYNGVDLEQFDRDRHGPCGEDVELAARQSILVTSVANLRPIKNHRMLLHAAQRVVRQCDRVTFALLGSGDEEPGLRALANELGLQPHVLFLGARHPVAPTLHRSAIGVLSSDSEGFSNAVLEYMAAGMPVVATDVGGVGEQVQDESTGFLVPAGDEARFAERILTLINNETLRQSMGFHGRQRVETEFNHLRQTTAYENLYEKLLATHGTG